MSTPTEVTASRDNRRRRGYAPWPPSRLRNGFSSTRSGRWKGDACQLEALPADVLTEIVGAAIVEHLHMDEYELTLAVERDDSCRAPGPAERGAAASDPVPPAQLSLLGIEPAPTPALLGAELCRDCQSVRRMPYWKLCRTCWTANRARDAIEHTDDARDAA
jgi:hypothetical protein